MIITNLILQNHKFKQITIQLIRIPKVVREMHITFSFIYFLLTKYFLFII